MLEHLPQARIMAIGEPIVIEPMEELHILRRPRAALYLIQANDLEHGTMRVFRAGHS
jgi:hypothetical protein